MAGRVGAGVEPTLAIHVRCYVLLAVLYRTCLAVNTNFVLSNDQILFDTFAYSMELQGSLLCVKNYCSFFLCVCACACACHCRISDGATI